jgi:hypothetical protein
MLLYIGKDIGDLMSIKRNSGKKIHKKEIKSQNERKSEM